MKLLSKLQFSISGEAHGKIYTLHQGNINYNAVITYILSSFVFNCLFSNQFVKYYLDLKRA